jgi:hypothetical protein
MTELTQRRIGVIYVERSPLYLPAARLVAQDEET